LFHLPLIVALGFLSVDLTIRT